MSSLTKSSHQSAYAVNVPASTENVEKDPIYDAIIQGDKRQNASIMTRFIRYVGGFVQKQEDVNANVNARLSAIEANQSAPRGNGSNSTQQHVPKKPHSQPKKEKKHVDPANVTKVTVVEPYSDERRDKIARLLKDPRIGVDGLNVGQRLFYNAYLKHFAK